MRTSPFLAAAVALTLAASAMASPGDIDLGDLTISNPTAYAASRGDRTRLRMKLSNEGRAAVHIIALTTPVAREAQFQLRAGPRNDTPIDAISVPADAKVELGGTSLSVELIGLSRALRAGERFPITLHFATGATATLLVVVSPGPRVGATATLGS